jgi:hypothetical protein
VARPRLPLAPFELLAFALAAAAAIGLAAHGFPVGSAFRYVAASVLHRLPGLLVAGLALQLTAQLVAGRPIRAWLGAVLSPPALGLLARTWLALLVTTFAYSSLKISVPLLRRTVLDESLWHWDQTLHLGVSPSVFAVELVRGTPLAPGLDFFYSLWLTSVLLVQSAVFWSADFGRRRHFALACVVLWLAGAGLYVALPVVGPCFSAPEVFASLRPQMPNAHALQARLWGSYQEVLAVREGARHVLRPFLAVAAFPSLHVGAHWLFALWARRHARRWFLPAAVATALTFFASLASGWHYAVDGYAGLLLAWLAVRLADRVEPIPAPDESQRNASGDEESPGPNRLDGGPEDARSGAEARATRLP